MPRILRVNGEEGGGIPPDDPGILLGLTVFETLRTYKERPFRLEAHLRRLQASAKEMRIPCPIQKVEEEIRAFCRPDVRIRYTLTQGGNRILDVAPIDANRVGAPVSVGCMHWEPCGVVPGWVKHGSRAQWFLTAQALGVDEVLLVDGGGNILEANRSNVFAVRAGRLLTPPLDGRQLPGVTRQALLEVAEAEGIPYDEVSLGVDDEFDEFYLASTLKELAPIVRMDGQPAPGRGPVGDALRAGYARLV